MNQIYLINWLKGIQSDSNPRFFWLIYFVSPININRLNNYVSKCEVIFLDYTELNRSLNVKGKYLSKKCYTPTCCFRPKFKLIPKVHIELKKYIQSSYYSIQKSKNQNFALKYVPSTKNHDNLTHRCNECCICPNTKLSGLITF